MIKTRKPTKAGLILLKNFEIRGKITGKYFLGKIIEESCKENNEIYNN